MEISMTRDEMLSVMSDLHKDARGYRPPVWFRQSWAEMSDAQLTKAYDALYAELEAQLEYERRVEGEAMDALRSRLEGLVESHGISMRDAIRWDMQAFDVDEGELEFWLWYNGVNSNRNIQLYKEMYA